MDSKKVLSEIVDYMMAKYRGDGIAILNQTNGLMSSVLELGLNCGSDIKCFKIVVTETQKKFV